MSNKRIIFKLSTSSKYRLYMFILCYYLIYFGKNISMECSELLLRLPRFWFNSFFSKYRGLLHKKEKYVSLSLHMYKVPVFHLGAAVMAQWIRVFTPQASPNERAIFEWVVKPQTNKQTNNPSPQNQVSVCKWNSVVHDKTENFVP